MHYLLFWMLGFATFWIGLKLFNDEVILLVSIFVGSAFVLAGLVSAPSVLQIPIEIVLIFALFGLCMQCIQRGSSS